MCFKQKIQIYLSPHLNHCLEKKAYSRHSGYRKLALHQVSGAPCYQDKHFMID